MPLQPETVEKTIKKFTELERALNEYLELTPRGSPGQLSEVKGKILSALAVMNKYVRVGDWGVAKAHSGRWNNDFLSIQPWSDKLSVLEDVN